MSGVFKYIEEKFLIVGVGIVAFLFLFGGLLTTRERIWFGLIERLQFWYLLGEYGIYSGTWLVPLPDFVSFYQKDGVKYSLATYRHPLASWIP